MIASPTHTLRFVKSRAAEFVELSLETVEHVDVHWSCNAVHPSLRRQLPIHQFHVGLVFAIACYPDVVALLDVGSVGHVAVDETLVGVENGLHARALLDVLHEDTDAPQ